MTLPAWFLLFLSCPGTGQTGWGLREVRSSEGKAWPHSLQVLWANQPPKSPRRWGGGEAPPLHGWGTRFARGHSATSGQGRAGGGPVCLHQQRSQPPCSPALQKISLGTSNLTPTCSVRWHSERGHPAGDERNSERAPFYIDDKISRVWDGVFVGVTSLLTATSKKRPIVSTSNKEIPSTG